MAYAQFLAGMAFNNASLGFVHAMAHQLGGFYDLPHGVCNAVLLPHVQSFNALVCAVRLTDVAHAMGADIRGFSAEEGAQAAIEAIRRLASDVDIPAGLRELGVRLNDIPTLASNALKDACGVTNPGRRISGRSKRFSATRFLGVLAAELAALREQARPNATP
jgi:alcohol dehydrogenase